METNFSTRCSILADLWLQYRTDEEFEDFMTYNDLGLPLAFAISQDIIKSTPQSDIYINEAFDLFLSALDLEDEGFETLDDLLIFKNNGEAK